MQPSHPVSARPRTVKELVRLPQCPEVLVAAEQRGITQVLHFTPLRGAVGILAGGIVKSRARLPEDEYLEYVYQPNAFNRRDPAWLDYVNLSIERINDWFFQASRRWHSAEGAQWVIFAFSPEILTHPGVVFTATNNAYRECLRSEGLAGFSQMFGELVTGYNGRQYRRINASPSWPTDRQAEVLYPGELSCEFLQRIDVQTERTYDDVHGTLGGLGLNVHVRYAPEVFQ